MAIQNPATSGIHKITVNSGDWDTDIITAITVRKYVRLMIQLRALYLNSPFALLDNTHMHVIAKANKPAHLSQNALGLAIPPKKTRAVIGNTKELNAKVRVQSASFS